MSFKKCKVVMLPTNEKAQKGQLAILDNRLITIMSEFQIFAKPKHLYITSDEEIKVGQNLTCIKTNQISKLIKIKDDIFITECDTELGKEESWIAKNLIMFKEQIIATTDKSITTPGYNSFDEDDICNCYLPKPSQQFIEKYIEEYNKGNVITDVLVEYEEMTGDELGCDPAYYPLKERLKLKVNPKDNTITIKKVKDSWNREEVSHLLNIAMATASAYGEEMNQEIADEWINEKL